MENAFLSVEDQGEGWARKSSSAGPFGVSRDPRSSGSWLGPFGMARDPRNSGTQPVAIPGVGPGSSNDHSHTAADIKVGDMASEGALEADMMGDTLSHLNSFSSQARGTSSETSSSFEAEGTSSSSKARVTSSSSEAGGTCPSSASTVLSLSAEAVNSSSSSSQEELKECSSSAGSISASTRTG